MCCGIVRRKDCTVQALCFCWPLAGLLDAQKWNGGHLYRTLIICYFWHSLQLPAEAFCSTKASINLKERISCCHIPSIQSITATLDLCTQEALSKPNSWFHFMWTAGHWLSGQKHADLNRAQSWNHYSNEYLILESCLILLLWNIKYRLFHDKQPHSTDNFMDMVGTSGLM